MHSSLRVLDLPISIKVNGICIHRNFYNINYLSIDRNLPIHPQQLRRPTISKGAISEYLDKASLISLFLKSSILLSFTILFLLISLLFPLLFICTMICICRHLYRCWFWKLQQTFLLCSKILRIYPLYYTLINTNNIW